MIVPNTSEIVRALKSGEYDGTMLMMAWCRLRDQEKRIEELESELEDQSYSHMEQLEHQEMCEESA